MARHRPVASPGGMLGLVALALLAPRPAVSASGRCDAVAAQALASCIKQTAGALRECAAQPAGSCDASPSVPSAAARLRRRVLGRCTEPAIRDAGFPPPFDPDELAGRLERTCRANALALLGRGADALGDT